ncbi:N-acetyltransferase [Anaerofustis butyriciformans]|uniref:GNAT family N-acetyltransferase n=1 Tax=Anaerofustis butyriciformans TaxID=3108533 RepID=UPI002E374F69|nr:N-acetyltransferase [Anaerofustis sp. HA2171]
MNKDYIIRKETKEDYKNTEFLTREAFFNVYTKGCVEHYVLHKLHKNDDYIKDLSFVVQKDEQLIGHIGYSNAKLIKENKFKDVLTFGPVSIIPEYKNKGIGSDLINYSIKKAKEMGYKAIIIYGNPLLYHRFGFTLALKFDIKTEDGKNDVPLLALELEKDYLSDVKDFRFVESEDFNINENDFIEFEKNFPYKEKKETYSQKEFEILSSLMW